MKKFSILISTIALAIAITLLALLVKNKIGDVRPAILPPSREIEEAVQKQGKTGEPVDFPLELPEDFQIGIFAPSTSSGQVKSLNNPRDLEFSPGDTLLISIPKDGKVIALPDKNNDGKADEVKDILSGLRKPHGLAFYNDKLFVAEETHVVRYNWDEDNLIATQDKIIFSLPSGGRHFTRTIAFDKDGRMFVSIGSTCDTCFEKNPWHGSVIISNVEGNNPRIFASGLRNAVFITINPKTDQLWGTEMGRDFLGDDLPPDEINIIQDGKDYGWPLCYGNKVHDRKFDSRIYKRSPCEDTEPPVYELQAHVAPLGLAFIDSPQFPEDWQGDLLVAYHGSWNRSTPIGYKVVHLVIKDNKVIGEENFISGWLQDSQALGRPVDLVFDQKGNLYISDNKASIIYIVSKN